LGKVKLDVRGTSPDSGTVKRVTVNGGDARPAEPGYSRWKAVRDDPEAGTWEGTDNPASAEDDADRGVTGQRLADRAHE
jgi:hypothetical protein